MSTIDLAPGRTAVLRGRDHPWLRRYAVARVGGHLAVGMSAGVTAKESPPLDPNEDVGAVLAGTRAALLVVADGHFGREASEVVVDHVLTAFGDDPPAPDLSDEELIMVFFEAGMAVERETTRADCVHPLSRTTLALALVANGVVQWAAIGDSVVVVATGGGGTRLNTPRNAFLGNRFTFADVASALTLGKSALAETGCVVLATDGLITGLRQDGIDVTLAVSGEARDAQTADDVVERLLARALRRGVADAVTVAVALV